MALDASYPALRAERERATRDALAAAFGDQEFDVMVARRILGSGWDKRLAALIFDANLATATAIADRVAAKLPGDYNPVFMHAWLTRNAELSAASINDSTRSDLKDAEGEDARAAVFAALVAGQATFYARSMVATVANFSAHDAAIAAGAEAKTWLWSGKGPRHQELGGQTVSVRQAFSNGMRWPGDPSGGAGNVANCACTVAFD